MPVALLQDFILFEISGVTCSNRSHSQKRRGLKNGISYESIKEKYVLIDKLYESFFIEIQIVKGKKLLSARFTGLTQNTPT